MSRFVAIFVCCLSWVFVAGCDDLPGKPTQAEEVPNPESVRDFAVLYQQNCSGCHGQDGKGSGAMALANPIYLKIVSDDQLANVTANGVDHSLMPPFAKSAGGTLTSEQIEILVHGMRSKWAKDDDANAPSPPLYRAALAGDAARGADVYATFCTSCHGEGGKGDAAHGSIVDPTFLSLVTDQYLRTTIIAGRPELKHPNWSNYVKDKPMTDQQVSDVVAWLASHRSAASGEPYPKTK